MLRRKLQQTIEEQLAKDNVVDKLEELRSLTARTTHPTTHQAWRPTGVPQHHLAATDLRVAERELEELDVVEQALASEVEQLEQRLEVAGRREERNREELERKEEVLVRINTKLATGAS